MVGQGGRWFRSWAGGAGACGLGLIVLGLALHSLNLGHDQSELLEPLVINGPAVEANSVEQAAIAAARQMGLQNPKLTGSATCEDCEEGDQGYQVVDRKGPSTVRIGSGFPTGSSAPSEEQSVVYAPGEGDQAEAKVYGPGELEKAGGSPLKGVKGIVDDVAGRVMSSFIQPTNGIPLQWKQDDSRQGTTYEGMTQFQLPNIVGPGHSVNPVQVNAKVVFPKPHSSRYIPNPCRKGEGLPCPNKVYSEEDMQTRLQAERKRVDELLADERKNWEENLLATKQSYRERLQALIQRSDALANKVRHLEAGGGTRLDLPEYVRVRNRVAGMSDAVAKLIADENLLQTHINHVMEEPGPRGREGADGVQGSQGLAGLVGPPGPPGLPGRPGIRGKHGADGPAGPAGPPGPPGRPGQDGFDGADGPPGPQGPMGEPGEEGPTGAQGATGKPGLPGYNGKDGVPGPIGPPGFNGRDGVDGRDGAEGAPGEVGAPGPIGPEGFAGLPGKPGIRGPPGPSGPPGPRGRMGMQGIPGPPGPKGDSGQRGAPGSNGQSGAAGADGAPSPPVLPIMPPSPPMPVAAAPGAAPPGVNVSVAPQAYTPEEYEPIIAAAIAAAMADGCGCAAQPVSVSAKQSCPCVKSKVRALKDKGKAIKSALAQVVRATERRKKISALKKRKLAKKQ